MGSPGLGRVSSLADGAECGAADTLGGEVEGSCAAVEERSGRISGLTAGGDCLGDGFADLCARDLLQRKARPIACQTRLLTPRLDAG